MNLKLFMCAAIGAVSAFVSLPCAAQTAEETVAFLVWGFDDRVEVGFPEGGKVTVKQTSSAPAKYEFNVSMPIVVDGEMAEMSGIKAGEKGTLRIQADHTFNKGESCKFSQNIIQKFTIEAGGKKKEFIDTEARQLSFDKLKSMKLEFVRHSDRAIKEFGAINSTRVIAEPQGWCVSEQTNARGQKTMSSICRFETGQIIDEERWRKAYAYFQKEFCKGRAF